METVLPTTQITDDAPRLELLHGWSLLTDPEGTLKNSDLTDRKEWRSARVGVPWTVLFPDLRDYLGVAWYRTQFEVPRFSDDRQVIIRFGAVDYFAEVFVNDIAVGTHEGGYTPFSFNVTAATKPGLNQLSVRVIDPPMDEQLNRALCPEMMYNEIPHGKQNWYLQNAGIWQGVRVEFCPAIYVAKAYVTPQVDGTFEVDLELEGDGLTRTDLCENTSVQFSVYDNIGRLVFEDSLPSVVAPEQSFQGRLKTPRLWSPQEPSLYTLEVSLTGAVSYRKRARFGFRKFEARDGKLFLNGNPFYMVGTLDQDFYPETIHTPASEEFVRDMMMKAKRMGINVLRCHLKVCHPVYLTVADELGMLVWCEMPSWSDCWYPSDHFSLKAAERGRLMFEEMLARDWNHPSIVIQTIMNESWGIDLKDATQRTWLKNTFNWIKELVTPLGRLVIDNSACEGNFHLKSDVEDFHNYYSMPDQSQLWEQFTADLCTRPSWTYSPYGDAERSGSEPIIVSEFGNWGLPKLPSELPWWFDRDFGGREVTRPAGVLERFNEYRFETLFGDYNDLAEETQWHQFISLKHEIENMRMHPEIQGYVITGMTDINWEANGLLDMWRNPKIFVQELAKLQQPDLLVPRLARTNYYSGEMIEVQLMLSHYGIQNLAGVRLRWRTDSGPTGSLEFTDAILPGSLIAAGKFAFPAPETLHATVERVYLEMRTRQGALISENTCEFFIFPRQKTAENITVVLHDPAGTLDELPSNLRGTGYRVNGDLSAEAILISSAFDEIADRHVSNGGKLLLLLDSKNSLPTDFPIRLLARQGCDLDGRWFSNYNWIRTDSAPFNEVIPNRVLGFESAKVVPRFVLDGVKPVDFDKVLAGVTYGWLAKNMALALPMELGKGQALLTTFRFHDYGTDPYATTLLDSVLSYLNRKSGEVA